jgi:arylsulfatase A-like enzyme
MSKYIIRRNPEKPSLWHMSFSAPHPPLVPLSEYMDLYRDIEIDMPHTGEWALNPDQLPFALKNRRLNSTSYSDKEIELAKKAFYAMCTHVDHQIRLILGLLREENILDNTILIFTSDHGDMLGNHGQFAKDIFYEESSKIPLILVPPANMDIKISENDKRLATQADILPTLLELCGLDIPETIEGESLIGEPKRKIIYGEHWEGAMASRMIRNSQYKLIYYPAGNIRQLFDINNDPDEMTDLSESNHHKKILNQLTKELINRLYGSDLDWINQGALEGIKINTDLQADGFGKIPTGTKRGLGGQRGLRLK